MEDYQVKTLANGTQDDAIPILEEFCKQNSQVFKFSNFNRKNKQTLVEALLKKLRDNNSSTCHVKCLECIRILSRDKTDLDILTSTEVLSMLVKLSGLEKYAKELGKNVTIQNGNLDVIVEAQKCLCNLIYNSSQAQSTCCENSTVEGILQRLKTYKDPDLTFRIKFFDMRILFLLTALKSHIRERILDQLHGVTYLTEVMELTLQQSEDNKVPLSDQDVDLVCEILKILFNVTLVTANKKIIDEEDEAHFMRLVSVLRDLLVCNAVDSDKHYELQSHTASLLINMPSVTYEELLTPLTEDAVNGVNNKDIEFEGKNMEAVVVLLDFMNRRLEDKTSRNVKENLAPILQSFCVMCRANRCIRKFCKAKVLPPLRDDVKRLPEEGDTLRNRLCKLLTSPVTEVKDLCADVLFVLCKENVGKMVKYTGYGNAAGLLAKKGLMGGGKVITDAEYSSESDDSDTEEYRDLENKINPVTGRVEEYPPPMEGMTDEQKEYEAIKLVNAMDRLQRHGIIQPTRIGEDGKPQAIEHVLELLENMPDAEVPSNTDEQSSATDQQRDQSSNDN